MTDKRIQPKDLVESVAKVVDSVKQYEDGAQPKAYLHERETQTKLLQREKKNPIKIVGQRSMRVPTGSPITEEDRKELAYLSEFVDGIFENNMVIGEGIVFWYNMCKADDYREWRIPANTPISVPRGIARHLSTRTWARFKEDRQASEKFQDALFEDVFQVDRLEKRVDFKPINVF